MNLSQAPVGLAEPSLLARIRAGLTASPKRLPFECFYDDLGSALFDAITFLPEYGLARAGRRLLERHAGEVAERLAGPLEVVEMGSGSGRHARLLLGHLALRAPVRYRPVDISRGALAECRREVERVPGVVVDPIEASHLDGLRRAAGERSGSVRLLVLFLGSNIGNFDRVEARAFLSSVRGALRPDDALLLGVDLEKPEEVLVAAYDDPLGVTAAFNLNVLARLNRELGADFELRRFKHQALYDRDERRIEMHLVSLADQRVRIRALGIEVRVAERETLWTESSYKFARDEVRGMGEGAGFRREAEWVDDEWAFSQSLLIAAGPLDGARNNR